ncbi:MAG: trigger factor, partial [Actinomycetota bacterium]
VLETRIGRETLRQEFLQDALPRFYSRALTAEGVRRLAPPSIEVRSFNESELLAFTVTVEVRPELDLPDYRGIEVTRPPAIATEEEVDSQLAQLRSRFATLEPIGRNAMEGDHLLIDLSAYRHSEKIEAASANDLLYEVGSNALVKDLDEELKGKRAGDILKVNAVLPERFGPPYGGQEISFSVIVKEVHAKRLPPLDDEFAVSASEFNTLEELRGELRRQIEEFKRLQSDIEVRKGVVDHLLDLVEVPVPETLVLRELRIKLGGLFKDLEKHQITLEDYLTRQEQTEAELRETYRQVAEREVAIELILEAVAEAEGIQVGPQEVDADIERYAKLADRPTDEVRRELEEAGRVGALAGDILRRKALDYLVGQVRIVDKAG